MSAQPPSPPETPDQPPALLSSGGMHDDSVTTDLKRKARFGAIALTLRMILLQITILVGGIALRRRLAVADFGAIAIAQVAMQFFAYFGDAGLGGALIQQKEPPKQRELSSIWCLQLVLSTVIVAVVWLAAPLMVRFWPDLPPSAMWLFRALSINLLLTAARVVPTVLMERELQFGRLSALEVLLVIPYYLVAIWLAHAGYGVFALVAAILTQGAFGVLGAFSMRPWRPSLIFDQKALRPILGFGIMYQLKNMVGFASGAITPVYAGRMLGQTQLGLIGWAQETAYFPLKLVEVISRISFPLYSRLQHDKELLARSIERSIQLCALCTLFFVGLILGLGPNIASVVYTSKWLPAVPILYVYAIGIAFGFLTPLVAPVFDATGRPQINLRFSVGWTVAIAALVPLTTPRWGAVGFAIGYCVPMILGNCLMLVVLKKMIPDARFWRRTRAAVVGGAVVATLGLRWLSAWATGPFQLVVAVLLEATAFVACVILLDRSLVNDALSILPSRRRRLPKV